MSLVLVLALVLAIHGVVRTVERRALVAEGPDVVARVNELDTRRWQRPVLGDAREPVPTVHAALASLKLSRSHFLSDRDLTEALRTGGLVPIQARDLADALTTELDGLVETTHDTSSSVVHVDDVDAHDPLTLLYATRLLLVRAVQSTPAACLALALDVLRLEQDELAGTSFGGTWTLVGKEVGSAIAVAGRCAKAAPPETLAALAPRFATLGRASPPLGKTLAGTALLAAASLAEWGCTEPIVPLSRAQLAAAIQCPATRRAASAWSREPERWFDVERTTVQATSDAFAEECRKRYVWIPWARNDDDATMPLAYGSAVATASAIEALLADVVLERGRFIATTRALAVAIATRAKLPQGDDLMADPFGGRLGVDVAADGAITVRSAGDVSVQLP